MTRPEGTAQKRERPRLGRPFDFQLHCARRCAKLIRCVSIFARKSANVTQRAAKPISITTRSRNISKIVGDFRQGSRQLHADTYRLFARDETGAGRKKRADVYIAAEISGSRIHHLVRVTSHVFRARHAVFKLQLCNTSAAPSETKRCVQLFSSIARSLNFRTGSFSGRNLRAKLRAAPPVE